MVIELQRLWVEREVHDAWLAADREVWTAALSGEPGFLGKEVWQGEGDEVVLVIRWRSRAEWEAVPRERLERLEREFRGRMPHGWETVEVRSYHVAGEAVAG